MQGFTSGSDVKLSANDVEVAVRPNDSGKASCADASKLFAAKKYPNTLTVKVTEGTLKISLSGDCSGNKWLCYDNFELTYYGDTSTAISEVAKKATAKTIFNVAGQQMKSLQKGLNIVDGKKVYVK